MNHSDAASYRFIVHEVMNTRERKTELKKLIKYLEILS